MWWAKHCQVSYLVHGQVVLSVWKFTNNSCVTLPFLRAVMLTSLSANSKSFTLTLLHSEWPKLHRVLAVLSAKGLKAFSWWGNRSSNSFLSMKDFVRTKFSVSKSSCRCVSILEICSLSVQEVDTHDCFEMFYRILLQKSSEIFS